MGKPNKFDGLLNDLCVGLGFCGCVSRQGEPKHITRVIPSNGSVTAQQFAELVIQSDWPEDDYDSPLYLEFRDKWCGTIAKRFAKHMGSDCVDASLLQSGV